MSYEDLKRIAYALYRPILLLEDVLPYESRRRYERALTVVLVLLGAVIFIGYFLGGLAPFAGNALIESVQGFSRKALGLFLIVLPVRASLTGLSAFHRSYYFRGLNQIVQETHSDNDVPVSFEIAAIMHYTPDDDVTGGFLRSPYGQDTMIRLGVTEEALESFLNESRTLLSAREVFLEREPGGMVLPVYVRSLYKIDQAFAHFLQTQGYTIEELIGAAEWIMRTHRWLRERERWYSRDRLGRIEGLGKDFAYGERYTLEKYGHYIEQDPIYAVSAETHGEDSEVEKLEAELARSRQANAILVGNESTERLEVLARLTHKIHEGHVYPPLEHKHLFLFDIGRLIGEKKTKVDIEEEFNRALIQAHDAGNIILAFDDAVAGFTSAAAGEVDIPALLAPFYDAPHIQIVLTANEDQLHTMLERDARIKQNFEVVRVQSLDERVLIQLLQQRALRLEHRHRALMTYPALLEIARGAHRYFSDATMPDKALDLMEETFIHADSTGVDLITATEVDAVIEGKTGIPLGEIHEEEQETLMHLEEELQKRVIGQTDALTAMAGALRRARAGINDPDRPIGTFLFIGPTGVGKTETAKALAELFFGDARAMHRFDMSEFQTPQAIDRLIGGSDGTPGRLVALLKEAPYHVVLLDEFEKASPQVHDLFLQILDEGEFTDALGHQVNARNTIIIATSNAGADLLYQALEEGRAIAGMEDEIIDSIVSRAIFRPELLNRFDDIILFHPLAKHEAGSVAEIALRELAERLREKGLTLKITDELIQYVTEKGYDPRFGGRNINRVIKETVEQAVADKIIAGEVKKGDEVVLADKDLP